MEVVALTRWAPDGDRQVRLALTGVFELKPTVKKQQAVERCGRGGAGHDVAVVWWGGRRSEVAQEQELVSWK